MLYIDRKEYLFRSFWDRDDCYKLIQELVQRSKNNEIQAITTKPVINVESSSNVSSKHLYLFVYSD